MSQSDALKGIEAFHEHRPLAPKHAHSHHHAHGHAHGHHHHHHAGDLHRPAQKRAFLICILLTVATMVAETIASYLTGSLMLFSDAIHMFSHAAALGVSYAAILIASRKASGVYSFGLFRIEILAAFVNGVILILFTVWIVAEGIDRIVNPIHIHGHEMTAVAVVGLVVNIATAAILHRSGVDDLNTKSAFLHMLGDTLSSGAIVIGAAVVTFTGWDIIDPLLSILIALVIARWSYTLLRDSTRILMERKPGNIDLDEVRACALEHAPESAEAHDLHVWEITSQYVCMSARVAVKDMSVQEASRLRRKIAEELRDRFGIAHAVIWFSDI